MRRCCRRRKAVAVIVARARALDMPRILLGLHRASVSRGPIRALGKIATWRSSATAVGLRSNAESPKDSSGYPQACEQARARACGVHCTCVGEAHMLATELLARQ